MARISRVVAAGYPHHITQRGNRRQQVFFGYEDYEAYIGLLSEWCVECGVDVWAYCLMPNHVHLMAVPKEKDGLARAIGETHRRYTRMVNFREDWRGYLWQGRFSSFPMEKSYAIACARYIELNPVRAKLVKKPEQWQWSSAGAHLNGEKDKLVRSFKPLRDASEWRSLLESGMDESDEFRKHERTGRPLGSDSFIGRLENILDRTLKRGKPGRKKKEE
jgi:putative transposase